MWWTPRLDPMRPLLLLLFALAFASSAHAAPHLDGAPRAARTGDVLHFTWSGLAPDVREVELELSLEGGRWVRLSPEMEAHEGGFAWRVPASARGIARVRLRIGGEWFERIAAESRAFEIVGQGPASSPEPGAEWWGVEVTGRRAPRREITQHLELAPAALDAEEEGRFAMAPAAERASRDPLTRDAEKSSPRTSEASRRATRHLPLRI